MSIVPTEKTHVITTCRKKHTVRNRIVAVGALVGAVAFGAYVVTKDIPKDDTEEN